MFSIPQGKPGVVGNYDSQPREVFYSGREFAQFWAPPVTVDGTNSSNPLNAPYTWLLWAGTVMGASHGDGKIRQQRSRSDRRRPRQARRPR